MTLLAERNDQLDLQGQLLRECLAMARYALAAGKTLPAAVAQTIEDAASQQPAGSEASDVSGPEAEEAAGPSPAVGPGVAAQETPHPGIQKLAAAHGRLSQIVAPATPRAILLLAEHKTKSGFWRFLGPVPLVRRMMFTALASLALFIAVALHPDVKGNLPFDEGSGLVLLLNLVFLLAAAALGACFAALFLANRFVVEGNYDPGHEPSYWIRFALGLIAGLILAELVPFGGAGNAAASATANETLFSAGGQGAGRLAKPLLALLGGFSAAVVYRILNRLVAAVDTLVRGETREIVAAQEQAAKARLAEQTAQSKMETLSRLVGLQQQISDGANSDQLKQKVAEILDDYLEGDLSAGARPRQPGPGTPDPGKAKRRQKAGNGGVSENPV